jgi:hypothetical protein
MLLAEWLRQDHRLGDQLPVMDSLCVAVTAAHRKSTPRSLAMDPQRINVQGDGDCHIPEGSSPTAYRAPESSPGVPATHQADIYSLAVILYEMLAHRHPTGIDASRKTHGDEDTAVPVALRDVRPDVPRDLVDAIMACLEADPEWRPKDLEYLLSVIRRIAEEQPASAPVVRAQGAAPKPKAAKPASDLQAARKRAAPESKSSPVTLAAVAVALVVLAVGGWYFSRQGDVAPPPAGPTPLPTALPSAPPPSLPETAVTPTPPPVAPRTTPTPAPSTPLPSPSVRVAAAPSAAPVAATAAPPTEAPVAAPVTTPSVAAATPPPPTVPTEPAVLTTLSPPKVKRPGNAIVDVRGTGLRADLVARIGSGREAAAGIEILRQRFVDPTLIQVVLRLTDVAAPGIYQLYLIDGTGTATNARALEVIK